MSSVVVSTGSGTEAVVVSVDVSVAVSVAVVVADVVPVVPVEVALVVVPTTESPGKVTLRYTGKPIVQTPESSRQTHKKLSTTADSSPIGTVTLTVCLPFVKLVQTPLSMTATPTVADAFLGRSGLS